LNHKDEQAGRMYNELLLDHFQNPRNVGELEPPALVVEVSNPICGDTMRLSAEVSNGRVVAARHRTYGCTAAIAAASAVTEWIEGKPVGELQGLDSGAVAAAVGSLPNESGHAAVLCVDAVKALLKRWSASR